MGAAWLAQVPSWGYNQVTGLGLQSQKIWLRLGNLRSPLTWLLAGDLQFFARRSFLGGNCVTAWVLPGWVIREWERESVPKKEATVIVVCGLMSEMASVTCFSILLSLYSVDYTFCWYTMGGDYTGVWISGSGSLWGLFWRLAITAGKMDLLSLAAVGKSVTFPLFSLLFLS